MATNQAVDGDPRRSRRGADPLALRIFDLLRPLSEEDKRCVLASLDAAETRGAGPERDTLARLAVDRFLSETGGPPSKRRYEDWRRDHRDRAEIPSATFVLNTFGTWAKAMDAMGLKPTADQLGYRLRSLGSRPSDERVIADLRRCAAALGRSRLLFREYRQWAKAQERAGRGANTLLVSPNSFISRFGSFAAALRRAGLESALNGPRTRSTENTPERLIEHLRAASEATGGGRVTVDRYRAWRDPRVKAGEAVPATDTISERFGGWGRALAAARLASPNEDSAGYGRGRGKKVSVDYMACCLLEAARARGLPLSIGSYGIWREGRRGGSTRFPPPASDSVIQHRIATWTTVRRLLEEAVDRAEPEVWLAAAFRAEERRRGR